MNDILEITPGIPLMLSSTSKGDAMKWYQPETNCYLKANRVDHGREYQDAIAEVIASRVGELLHIPVVQYQLCHIRIDDEKLLLGTISHNFCHIILPHHLLKLFVEIKGHSNPLLYLSQVKLSMYPFFMHQYPQHLWL